MSCIYPYRRTYCFNGSTWVLYLGTTVPAAAVLSNVLYYCEYTHDDEDEYHITRHGGMSRVLVMMGGFDIVFLLLNR